MPESRTKSQEPRQDLGSFENKEQGAKNKEINSLFDVW